MFYERHFKFSPETLYDNHFITHELDRFPPRRKSAKRTIVFDLDHTLVESIIERAVGKGYDVKVWMRRDFLFYVHELRANPLNEVILWTNGRYDYAAQMVSLLKEVVGDLFEFVISRPLSQKEVDIPYLKDLKNIKRESNSVLVDDMFHDTSAQIICPAFRGGTMNEAKEEKTLSFIRETIESFLPLS